MINKLRQGVGSRRTAFEGAKNWQAWDNSQCKIEQVLVDERDA